MNEESQRRRRILFATDEVTKFWGLMPAPAGFDCDHVCGWHAAVVAVIETKYDVVVATYPLGDRPFRLFVHAVRSTTSRSQRAGLVVLTTPDQKSDAAAFIGKGVNRVIAVDEGEDLHDIIAEVIDISPRASARLMVQLQMPVGDRDYRLRTFSENISESGMLLGTPNRFEVGQVFDFEFTVPGGEGVVAGTAEVVRHTDDQLPEASGVGIRFLDLHGRSHDVLSSFLELDIDDDDFVDHED